jgi:uroporphyrinogen-III synthase
VGCIAGALSRTEYVEGLAAVGFVDVSVRYTQQAADGMHNAIVQATKPITVSAALATSSTSATAIDG